MSNVIKLLALCGALVVVLLINAALFVTNMISIDTGLELLNTEKRPLGHVPVVGPVLKAIAPQATLSNWYALVIAALMSVGAYVAFHYAFKVVRLLFDIRLYRRTNQPDLAAAALEMIGRDLIILAPVIAAMTWLVQGDLYLFAYRGVAAAVNIDDPTEAASRIGVWWNEAEPELAGAAVWFATSAGPTMYLSASLLAPMLVEVVVIKMQEVWNRIYAAIATAWANATGANVEPVRELFGYDANGMPVFDPNAPIAYDTDQRPVAGRLDAEQVDAPEPEVVRRADEPVDAAVMSFPAPQERVSVIGGRPGDTVTLAHALQQPALYHVERATRRVYQRAYWDRLNGAQQGQDENPKEAA